MISWIDRSIASVEETTFSSLKLGHQPVLNKCTWPSWVRFKLTNVTICKRQDCPNISSRRPPQGEGWGIEIQIGVQCTQLVLLGTSSPREISELTRIPYLWHTWQQWPAIIPGTHLYVIWGQHLLSNIVMKSFNEVCSTLCKGDVRPGTDRVHISNMCFCWHVVSVGGVDLHTSIHIACTAETACTE